MRCTADREALKKDDKAWAALKFVGIQRLFDDEPAIELRDCPCGCRSTLCREVK